MAALYLLWLLLLSAISFGIPDPGLPKSPFMIIWNAPSENCEQKWGIQLKLNDFGIISNPNQTFLGKYMTIFYQLGLFPHIVGNSSINGGIPQLGNLTAHLEKVVHDIITDISNSTYQGLTVIDMEYWRPQWEQNYESELVYQERSKLLVKSEHPDWSDSQIENEARFQFEEAAHLFLSSTLLVAKQLIPEGNWGYYHYPYCSSFGQKKICESQANDEIPWLFHLSQSLYPSAYFSEESRPDFDNQKYIEKTIQESFRVNIVNNPLFLYTRFSYSTTEKHYTIMDLENSLGQTSDSGFSGAVLWGSSEEFESESKCLEFQKYLDSVLGPCVKDLLDKTMKCSNELCSGNGRCVKNKDNIWLRFLSVTKILLQFDFWAGNLVPNIRYPSYRCQCYPYWTGTSCNIPTY